MDASAAVTIFFQFVSTVGFILTGIRLYSSGIYRKYRVFFAYLVFSIIQTALLLAFNPRSAAYFRIWMATEPFLWVLYVMVVMELYALVLERYKGLYTIGRWALWGSVVVAVGLSGLTLLHQVSAPNARQTSLWFSRYLIVERGVVCAMLIFLFLIMILLTRYPVRLSRNVIVHCAVYSAFFLTSTFSTLLRGVFGIHISRTLSLVHMGINALCVLLWVLFLDAKGETRLVSISTLKPEQEERVLETLSALNATALRAARK